MITIITIILNKWGKYPIIAFPTSLIGSENQCIIIFDKCCVEGNISKIRGIIVTIKNKNIMAFTTPNIFKSTFTIRFLLISS